MNSDFEEIPINLRFFSILVIFNKKENLIERVKFLKKDYSGNRNSFIESMITDIFYGKRKVNLTLLNLKPLTDFQRKVLIETLRIPRGKVTTYKRISERVGIPNGARSVGNVMRINPFPIIIPCHRVVKSDGSVGNYGGGRELKRKILLFEKVKFKNNGKVFDEFVI